VAGENGVLRAKLGLAGETGFQLDFVGGAAKSTKAVVEQVLDSAVDPVSDPVSDPVGVRAVLSVSSSSLETVLSVCSSLLEALCSAWARLRWRRWLFFVFSELFFCLVDFFCPPAVGLLDMMFKRAAVVFFARHEVEI